MTSAPKCFIVTKEFERIDFPTYADAVRWVKAHSAYPKGIHHIYDDRPYTTKSDGMRKSFGAGNWKWEKKHGRQTR